MQILGKKKSKSRNFFKKYRLTAFFALLLLAGIIFWGNISWVFNGEVWRQFLSDYFPQYFPKPYVMVEHTNGIESYSDQSGNNSSDTNENSDMDEAITENERRDLLSIPKLSLVAPIITAATTDSTVVYGLLDSGVVLYPGSAAFGETGQTVILGHSAPTGWPKIKYDWVFSRLNELESGDMVVVTYDNITRYYSVVNTRVVTPQEGVPNPTVTGNSMALVSCWPPGKDLKRIVVETTISTQ
jgi:LPXTG-site transpeptidase (sortase) family protein